jgi:hypothetical protein
VRSCAIRTEIVLFGLDSGVEEGNRANERESKKKITAKDAPEIYPVATVQVTKGSISNEGGAADRYQDIVVFRPPA